MVNFKDTTRAYFCRSQEINRLREEIDRLLSKGMLMFLMGVL